MSAALTKPSQTEKLLRLVFLIAAGAEVLFQLFQAAGFALLYDFLRGYALGIVLLSLLLTAALVLCLFRQYLPSALLTLLSTVGLTALGYALSHPVVDPGESYISGIPEGVFWKFFAPSLLLLIPILALTVSSLRRKKEAYDNMPYEKQFD